MSLAQKYSGRKIFGPDIKQPFFLYMHGPVYGNTVYEYNYNCNDMLEGNHEN